jgi:hypothetical protein
MGTDMLVIKSLQLGIVLLLFIKDPLSIIRIIRQKVDPAAPISLLIRHSFVEQLYYYAAL